jgi:outer membrane protein TolC
MRWMTGVLALTGVISAEGQQVQPQQHVEVTLQEAIQRALDVQPLMVAARGEVRSTGAAMRASNGAFLPTITTGGSWGRRGGTTLNSTNQVVTLPTSNSYSGTISANIDLFVGFRRLADRRASTATRDAADAGLVDQRFRVILDTRGLFYDALATEELVRVAQSQVRRAQQQLQISVEKLRAGSATRSDSLRSTVDFGNARIALLEAQANLAAAQANLGRQIGVDQPVRAVPDSVLPALPDTVALRAIAVDRAPRVEQADAQVRAARARVAVSRATYFPSIRYSAGNSTSSDEAPWDHTNPFQKGWNVGVSVSWILFNGFSRESQVVSAAVARDNAEANAADTRRAVTAQVAQQIAALTTAYEKIDIARANVAAATEDVRVQNERYRVGAATILDLLTSQASLTQAEQNIVQVRFDYLLARAQLEALVGHEL